MTVADQVFARVEELTAEGGVATRAEAIRRVAEEMGRSVSATSSAFYTGARRHARAAAPPAPATAAAPARARRSRAAAPPAPAAAPAPATRTRASTRRARDSGHSDAPRLYAEMLPLVEAGASIEQAARRFGDEESVPEIAAGFVRWREREGLSPSPAGSEPDPSIREMQRAGRDSQARITALEAENRGLRRDLTRAQQVITRIRSILDSTTV